MLDAALCLCVEITSLSFKNYVLYLETNFHVFFNVNTNEWIFYCTLIATKDNFCVFPNGKEVFIS